MSVSSFCHNCILTSPFTLKKFMSKSYSQKKAGRKKHFVNYRENKPYHMDVTRCNILSEWSHTLEVFIHIFDRIKQWNYSSFHYDRLESQPCTAQYTLLVKTVKLLTQDSSRTETELKKHALHILKYWHLLDSI